MIKDIPFELFNNIIVLFYQFGHWVFWFEIGFLHISYLYRQILVSFPTFVEALHVLGNALYLYRSENIWIVYVNCKIQQITEISAYELLFIIL